MKACTGPYNAANPYGYDDFSFLDDVGARRRMAAALRERAVTISLAEGFVVIPGADLTADLAGLDVMWELGATRANVVTMDADLGRSFDQFAAFAEAAAERGLQTTLEFAKSLALTDLETAVAAVRHVGRADFRLLIDTMHVVRSGSTAADLASLDSSLVGYAQLCDNTLEQRSAVYREDSSDRLAPGEGELPLVDIMLALPEWVPVGVEVPMRSRATAGMPARTCARLAVEGARDVLAQVRAERGSRKDVRE
jgi:sugar phosphate isomerase/epimerase